MANGTLIAAMNMAQVAADEFDDWYDTEHLPERQRVPGFLVCQRWIGAEDGKISVATYDLDTVEVLKSLRPPRSVPPAHGRRPYRRRRSASCPCRRRWPRPR